MATERNTSATKRKVKSKGGFTFITFLLCFLLLIAVFGFGVIATLRSTINETALSEVAQGINYGDIPIGAFTGDSADDTTLCEMVYGMIDGIGLPITEEEVTVMIHDCGIADFVDDTLVDYCAYITDGSGNGYIESEQIATFAVDVVGDYMRRLLGDGVWNLVEPTLTSGITRSISSPELALVLEEISLPKLEAKGAIDIGLIRFLISDIALVLSVALIVLFTIFICISNKARKRRGLLHASIAMLIGGLIFLLLGVSIPSILIGNGGDAMISFIVNDVLIIILDTFTAIGVITLIVGVIELLIGITAKRTIACNTSLIFGGVS